MILSSSTADFFLQMKNSETKHMFIYSNNIESWGFIDMYFDESAMKYCTYVAKGQTKSK